MFKVICNRYSYFLALALLCLNSVNAQTTYKGQVLDSDNNLPLVGALVYSVNEKQGVNTDQNGNFKINLNDNKSELEIRYLGYDNSIIDLSSEDSDLGIILLKQSRVALEEITISATGTSYNSKFKGSNYKISNIELRRINPVSTEEILKTVPGVNIVGDMGISNRPNISIRGSWGRRSKKVLLLEDGTPAAPAPYIAPGAYYNPVSDRIRSIEIYKGADILRYGPNNMYGAVNYITALPPQKPELRVKLLAGERDYYTGLLSYGGTWKNLGALVEGVYKTFGGFTDNSSVSVLNLNAKIFAKLTEKQSLYFKLSGQSEDNQASLSSITPFTFNQDPLQNPLDADQFTMRRYGVDIIHKWSISDKISLKSKIYATDFERDWWRQITAKVKAQNLKSYLGEDRYMKYYSYTENLQLTDNDYVIVGKVENGRESTTDSRWTYTVSGLTETINMDWSGLGSNHKFEASVNLHRETFKDRFLRSDSTKWARYGETTKDLWYQLWSSNAYIRNEFNFNNISVTPILRFEYVDMYRQDLRSLSFDPDLIDTEEGRESNSYTQFLPGLSINYRIGNHDLYTSLYSGMIAPSKVFGFLVEQDGVITNPLDGQDINIKPELSRNFEIGWRGSILNQAISGQLCYFNNTSWNFYAGGRSEVFEELGRIRIQGVEMDFNTKSISLGRINIGLTGNLALLNSKVLSGSLKDNDLFSQVIHSEHTRNEFITKVNQNRNAYIIHVLDDNNQETLHSGDLDIESFDRINSCLVIFGKDHLENASSPYTPNLRYMIGLNLEVGSFGAGINTNVVSSQYTEFHNFENESNDGAIGKLDSYQTIDAYFRYDFNFGDNHSASLFLNGKNIGNQVYKASRLNRATSGIFPGGFRQLIFGVSMNI